MSAIAIGFAGGYTAGHVMPLIALAEAWRARYPDDRLECYGASTGIEAELVSEAGLPFRGLPASAEYGAGLLGRIRAYAAAFQGLCSGRRLMRSAGLDLLVCFGGYACAGAGMAATSLGIPLAVFEANAVPGRSNDLLARFAQMRLAAMPETRRYIRWGDADLFGLPQRRPAAHREAAGADRAPRLLITGGTFGSAFLNRVAPDLAADLAADGLAKSGGPIAIVHQAGLGREAEVAEAYRARGISADVIGFDTAFPARWRWADAALCSAGAGTLTDAMASGTPTLAVPIARVAQGHQEANARAAATRHGLDWVRENDWRPDREARRIVELLRRPKRQVADHDSAARLVQHLRAAVATNRPAAPGDPVS